MKLAASSTTLLLRYSQKALIPRVAGRYLRSPVHPLRPKIAHMYENRDPNTLWLAVTVSQIGDFKRVVRSWCARRTRLAFQNALKQQGFDRLGAPLDQNAQEQRLTGSLEIIVRPLCVKKDFATVQQDAHQLLESLLSQRKMHLERAARGSNEPSESSKFSKPFDGSA